MISKENTANLVIAVAILGLLGLTFSFSRVLGLIISIVFFLWGIVFLASLLYEVREQRKKLRRMKLKADGKAQRQSH